MHAAHLARQRLKLREELKERARLNPRRRRRRRRITDAPTEQPNTRPNQSPPYLQARKDLKRVVDGRFTEYRGYRAPNLRVQTVYYLREGPPLPRGTPARPAARVDLSRTDMDVDDELTVYDFDEWEAIQNAQE
ncbi:hypothetical protein PCANC_27161 [Puccinia coronata f. sp. avenae]|uniref:Uncharacterized protein n=1 Tax=Puccinia coronata f. sp. avenae TaxID=200324 RepID=A0A2N5TIU2_9BASI|nr:hypothetical protein PCANC_27161 [Puccinia coronata f. sp. avenae]PLW29496.1 hypothetical protein PCASD_24070 [Puccinia coronata f. sp. avenae]PLW31474.1 hypothetical protein PCASD_17884 [Puccinia coronata f. sp. avenae]